MDNDYIVLEFHQNGQLRGCYGPYTKDEAERVRDELKDEDKIHFNEHYYKIVRTTKV